MSIANDAEGSAASRGRCNALEPVPSPANLEGGKIMARKKRTAIHHDEQAHEPPQLYGYVRVSRVVQMQPTGHAQCL